MKYLNDLKKIIEINSHTGNKQGVDKVGQVMQKWLEALDFTTHIYTREFIGDHLLFKSKRKAKTPCILLLGHNDTVFPKDYFEGFQEDDEWVYGPGVCDMKGGNIVALQALRNIFQMHKNIYNIDVLLVSDEETGSDDSSKISSELAKDYTYCFVFEAAGKNLEIVTARKGVGRYIIKVEGKASHAGTSYKKGINANLEAAHKFIEYSDLIDFNKGTVVNIGKIEGGIGINTVSPHCEMLMEFRFESKEERQRVEAEVKRITSSSKVEGTITHADGIIQRDVMEENQKQHALISFIENLTQDPLLREHRGGVSDANIVSNEGVITLDGFGPFGDGDHTKKERALKSSFEQRIKLMTTILSYFQKHFTLN